MSNYDDLSGFVAETRQSNLGNAQSEAMRIHNLFDFKKYISQAIANGDNTIEISFEDAIRARDQDGNFDPYDGWQSEYIRPNAEIFAGEEVWLDVLTYLVEIVQSQGISCSLLSSIVCNSCHWIFDDDERPDGDGEINCDRCRGEGPVHTAWRKVSERGTGLRIHWE